jgi:hypothetical protein
MFVAGDHRMLLSCRERLYGFDRVSLLPLR